MSAAAGPRPRRAVMVVGIGQEGCLGLSAQAMQAISRAQILVGAERQLAFFPQFNGERIVLKGPLRSILGALVERSAEDTICLLASGDPLFFGVGALLGSYFEACDLQFFPQPSSVQWAFSRIGVPWGDAELLTVHGREWSGLCARLRHSRKAAVLCDGKAGSASRVAAHLLDYGLSAFEAHVCEDLGGSAERIRRFSLPELATCVDLSPLHLLILLAPERALPPVIPYAEEAAFEKETPKQGLITKREVRALSVAALRLRPDAVIWDVGAASGSVAIEAALLAPRGQTYAIEAIEARAEQCRRNARAFGADHVRVVVGTAPAALAELPDPDAVFVGGSRGELDPIIRVAFERLRAGGRMVINAVTMESVAEAQRSLVGLGLQPEATLIQIARGAAVGRYNRWDSLNPVHMFAVEKPLAGMVGNA